MECDYRVLLTQSGKESGILVVTFRSTSHGLVCVWFLDLPTTNLKYTPITGIA